jgi:putative DNA primase/helicase
MYHDDLRDRCRGRWPSILVQLGLDRKALGKRNVPCPMCGGCDRFQFTDLDGNGTWHCRSCGGGWGLDLVMAWKGVNFVGARDLIVSVEPSAAITREPRPWRPREQVSDESRRIWMAARPLDGADPASTYLIKRGILDGLPRPQAARYVEAMPHRERDAFTRVYPALAVRMIAPDDSSSILQFVFLTQAGFKAALPKVKLFLPGSKVPMGGAVRITEPAEEMGVATGLETALSVIELYHVPVWAALTDGNLLKFAPPPMVRRLLIFGDRDRKFSGQVVAYGLARRLAEQRPLLDVDVVLPPRGEGKDFNDTLRRSLGLP